MRSTINRTQANQLWREFFTRKGRAWLPVLTGSMAPLIRPGDQVLVHVVPAERIGLGDIIVFKRNDDLIVHRVVKKWREARDVRFREQGDATYVYGLVNANDVVGRVTMVRGGSRMLDLTAPSSRITNVVLTVCLSLTTNTVNHLRRSKNKTVRIVARVLSELLLLLSNLLVRACIAVWYLSGLFAKKDAETMQVAVAKGEADWP